MATETKKETSVSQIDIADILAGFAGKVAAAADLGKALKAGGHTPAEVVPELVATKAIGSLGNTSLDKEGEPIGFRFFVPKVEKTRKVWVRAQHGPAVQVPGFGTFDRFGQTTEAGGSGLAYLRSRETPVEVIDDSAKIAKLKEEAEKREAQKAAMAKAEAERRANTGKVSKRALAELG